MNFWNQQFSGPDFKYGKQPNTFVRDEAFHPLQLEYQSGGPKFGTMLYAADMLRSNPATDPSPVLNQVLAWKGEASS